MANQKKSKGGMSFLLVILIACPVAVAGLGIAAAIGMPTFIGYIKKSKTSEATSNLKALFTGAAAYYQTEHAIGLEVERNCTVSPARSSNTPMDTKTIVNWGTEDPSFDALMFTPADPIYYQYEIDGAPTRCANLPNGAFYTFRAHGDLDGDGVRSLFELSAGTDGNNELYRGAGFFIENETE